MYLTRLAAAITVIVMLVSCNNDRKLISEASGTITAAELMEYTGILGSDQFMGRAPFTKGETISINYLSEALDKIGFEPLFGDSWFQQVPLMQIVSEVVGSPSFNTPAGIIPVSAPDEIAITSPGTNELTTIEASELVFAGFGIVAPDYGWNDYEGLDVKGKTVVVFINDPGLYTGDKNNFKGREMTLFGRWTYKFEEAARQGAAGILIVHDKEGAGYTYDIPRKSSITPRFFLQTEDNNASLCRFTGWITGETASKLFSSCRLDIDSLRRLAIAGPVKGFPMNATIDLSIKNRVEFNNSTNVGGILRGNERPDECIIYTAHWDHFGIGEAEAGDSIYNGAIDNGTSMAWALEIGEAFSAIRDRIPISVVILFPTAEEQGLLGSKYYVSHPPIPPSATAAAFNNDMMLPIGRMKDLMITGYGQSDLDDLAQIAAKRQDRYIMPDPNAHTGMYFRSDHFPFAAAGVPAMFARGNCDSRMNGKEWAQEKEESYLTNHYHRPGDNFYPASWDMSGIVEDAVLAFEVGYEVMISDKWPKWKDGSEFKYVREKDPPKR